MVAITFLSMKKYLTLLVVVFMSCTTNVQEGVYFSLDSALANPEAVRTLVVNPNYDQRDTMPDALLNLRNLTTLYFLPNYFSKFKGSKLIYEKQEGTATTLPQVVPDLRILFLPENIGQLGNLESLTLKGNLMERLPWKSRTTGETGLCKP
jgi:Leucine-rich repeat (LRR) protein